MSWVEVKYAGLASSRLTGFKQKSSTPYVANFKCHLCGDSKTNKTKTRGYLYEEDNRIAFKCHNCGSGLTFGKFLDSVDPQLSKEYRMEWLKENGSNKPVHVKTKTEFEFDIGKFSKPRFAHCKYLKPLKKISQLSLDHHASVYVHKRKIPSNYHYKLYYCEKFAKYINAFLPGKFPAASLQYDEPRLIIPFIDADGYMFGLQGRSFKPDTKLRYITIMFDENKPKIFGLDGVDLAKKVYIVEGPIDSMFVRNSIALAGADGIPEFINKNNCVMIYDNQPRNVEIVKKISKIIERGYPVVIWPDSISAKDINDLYLSGANIPEIMEIIDKNTYKGIAAYLRFKTWKKVTI